MGLQVIFREYVPRGPSSSIAWASMETLEKYTQDAVTPQKRPYDAIDEEDETQ